MGIKLKLTEIGLNSGNDENSGRVPSDPVDVQRNNSLHSTVPKMNINNFVLMF